LKGRFTCGGLPVSGCGEGGHHLKTPLVAIAVSLAAAACSLGVRKDATPPIAPDAVAGAVREAALEDPGAGPELSATEQIEHALARTTFGPRPGDRERIARVGIAAFLEEQLHPERIDDAPVEAELTRFAVLSRSPGDLAQELAQAQERRKAIAAGEAMEEPPPPPPDSGAQMPDPNVVVPGPKPGGDLRRQLGKAGRGPGFEIVAQLAEAKLVRAVDSDRQLREVMTDFWFNHFNVFAGKMNEAALLPGYEKIIREHALGNFGQLLRAVAHSPAMLIYLDNWRSAFPRPAERRGRPGRLRPVPPHAQRRGINENYARELLELHTLGVDGGYTQEDVIAVARCFTGWTVKEERRDPRFAFEPRMHDFGPKRVLGKEIAEGQGEEDGEQVLDLLVHHASTARFVASKLARKFVSDDPPEALVDRVARTFRETSGDIRAVLRTILESPEFWSRRALRAKVRSPLELVAGSVRALDARVDDPMGLLRAVGRIGEPLFAAQPPTGYLDTAQNWLSAGALLARIDFGLALASGQLEGVLVDLSAVSRDARGPGEVLDRASGRIGAPPLSEKTRAYILTELRELPAQSPVAAARAVGLLFGAPELQRR
jgi:uncharacterized protein (DUF1800 family)